jgi:hypothetical protein
MGAWGTGIFESDCSLDALADLKESGDTARFIESVFDRVIDADDYIDVDETDAVSACAAVMAAILNGDDFFEDCDENKRDSRYVEWFNSIKSTDCKHLKDKAIKALNVVLTPELSESYDLWAESGEDSENFIAWKSNHEQLIAKLQKI